MLRGAILFLGLTFLLCSAARAEKRVALVIGNGAYAKVGKLPNPTRDTDAMAALFRTAGFDVVEAKRDLGVAAMRRALRDFTDHVRDADIAVVSFAGHGIEVNGTNYLIPVDAALERDIDVEDETVSLDRVTQILEQAKRLRLVILDACRDNPFARSMKRTVASRSIGRGLAEVRVLTADTLIAFAAKAGSTAADGEGTNSPYTLALAKHLATPGLDVRLALGRVRDEVLKSTGSKQEPFVYGSLGGSEIPLVAGTAEGAALALPVGVRPSASLATAGGLFTEQHARVLQSLAQDHKLRLPEFRIEIPDPDLPLHLRRFVGIWIGKTGRTDLIIATRAYKDGRLDGYFACGPRPPGSRFPNTGPCLWQIAGAITGGSLRFTSPNGQASYRLTLNPSNTMDYVVSNTATGETGTKTFSPVWTLVDAERSARR